MYIPQLFEMLSEPLHAERIVHAERKRLALAPCAEPPAVRISLAYELYRRLRTAPVSAAKYITSNLADH